MTDTEDSAEPSRDSAAQGDPEQDSAPASDDDSKSGSKRGALREGAILVTIALVLYYVMLTFVARPYLIPSESMEPTLHGCAGCTGDRIMVDKVSYRFGQPEPGDVIVFKGPPAWNVGYQSIRSDNTAIRWVQNALSFIGFVPPDENDLVKRVIAVGGQTVQCRNDTGLTVDGKRLNEPYLDPETLGIDQEMFPCWGKEFGPLLVPDEHFWVMGDNRTHSSDSRAHCNNSAEDRDQGIYCTGDAELGGDPNNGTVPLSNVIGKARFIAWPPGRWGGVTTVNPQHGEAAPQQAG